MDDTRAPQGSSFFSQHADLSVLQLCSMTSRVPGVAGAQKGPLTPLHTPCPPWRVLPAVPRVVSFWWEILCGPQPCSGDSNSPEVDLKVGVQENTTLELLSHAHTFRSSAGLSPAPSTPCPSSPAPGVCSERSQEFPWTHLIPSAKAML